MKTIRNTVTLVGVSLMLFALCAAGAKAQGLYSIDVTGTFTLPFEAQWGPMTLPAGDYNLYYGSLTTAGTRLVEVKGQAEGSPHGFLLTKEQDSISTTKSALICIRQGNRRIVRELQMAPIGETVSFPLPHGVKLLAHQQNGNVYARLAEAPVIERVPVNTSGR
ncbi:MAG: hypothetical protein P8Z30_09170 [Acidobacteriota bacterium]